MSKTKIDFSSDLEKADPSQKKKKKKRVGCTCAHTYTHTHTKTYTHVDAHNTLHVLCEV